jgi:hypothetical protein
MNFFTSKNESISSSINGNSSFSVPRNLKLKEESKGYFLNQIFLIFNNSTSKELDTEEDIMLGIKIFNINRKNVIFLST